MSAHQWKFFRAGGFDQVLLRDGADLLALDELDQKLWVALSCPTTGLEFDPKTLAHIDTDKDGRIRAPELIAAIRWTASCLSNPDDLTRSSAALPLASISERSDEGRKLRSLARRVLDSLGKHDAKEITPDDSADTTRIFESMPLNGDGIVPPEAATDAAIARVLGEIIERLGGEADRGGKPGVSKARFEQFFVEAQAFSDWWKRAEDGRSILPLGEATAAAAALVARLKPKVEDYFTRCRLAAFDPRAEAALNRQAEDYQAIASKDLSLGAAEIIALPLARVASGRPLPLGDGLNPAFTEVVEQLQRDVVTPLCGERTALTEADWGVMTGRLAAFEAWSRGKPRTAVEGLGLPRIRAILGGNAKAEIASLVEKDLALTDEANSLASLDKLVRLHRDLFQLANNFVSFRDFYSGKKAIFQAGTAYFDQRSCDLCIRVHDAPKHGLVASSAGTYLAYCDLSRQGEGEKYAILAAVTAGDSGNLMVGRNGIFYDRQGRDWDATITKLIEHPISVWQAFWSPYRRVARLIGSQIEKFAESRDKEASARAEAQVGDGAKALHPEKEPPKKDEKAAAPFDVARFAGIFAAIGLAIGAIGGALGALLTAFTHLAWWQMPVVLGALTLLISGPSMLLAGLKLRRRNLGPLLDANGWAVNAKARINIPFGRSLTAVAKLPPGAKRDLADPFAEKSTGAKTASFALVLAVVLLGAWYFGWLNEPLPWLPRSGYVERHEAK